MRIASFNVNDVRRRLPNLLAWLAATRPDLALLQETKVIDRDVPAAALRDAGFGSAWHGQPRWNGVAILARGADPVVTRRGLPGDALDTQARYLEAAVGGVLIGNLYAPNGNPQPGPKFDYKLAWMDRLAVHAAALQATGLPVLLAGDFNVVPTDRDIYAVRSWRDNALLQPGPRAAFQALLDAGWTDAFRALYPDAPGYTFWSFLRDAWPRDAGLRIDHLLVSRALAPRLVAAGVDRDVRGAAGASDHAPAWITLRHQPVRVG